MRPRWDPPRQENTVQSQPRLVDRAAQSGQGRIDQAYILGCINGRFNQPVLFHLPWNPVTNDSELFLQLQRQYNEIKGAWRRKFSLWTLQGVLFIQVR